MKLTLDKIYIILTIVLVALMFFAVKQCQPEPVIVTKTKTEYIKITDTITKTKIDTVPKLVYVEKIKTEKGKDSIIYVNQPSDTSITANKYTTELISNNAKANLQITTTGKLLDVQGTINYTQTNTTIENTKIVPRSGLFAYLETSTNPIFENSAIGLDYHIKNTILIGASTSYNNISKTVNFNVKLGFRVFNRK